MFEHNPSQYKKLFILLNIDLKAETITQLRTISQKIHAYYSSYSRDKTIRDTLDVSLAAKEKVASADTKVASSDGKMIEQRTSIEKITSAIPRSWNSRLEKYISGNIGNSEFFKKETYSNPQLKAETEDEKILYLQTIFFIDHQEEIRADMQKSLESAPPSEKEKIQENINSFEKYISVLN